MKASGIQYVVYYRVSTKGQGESGLGMEAQVSMIHSFLTQDQIAAEFTEVISAKVLPSDRPQLAAAIEYAKQNGCGLAVAKVDRLSRVTEHALDIYQQMKGFIFSCDIPMTAGAAMDKFTLTIYMAIADRERELIGIRTKAALLSKVTRFLKEKGQDPNKYLNARLKGLKDIAKSIRAKFDDWPLGTAKNIKGAWTIAEEARRKNALSNDAWIKAAYEATARREKGMSFQAIADELNRKGFTTRRGHTYQPTTVKRLIAKQLD